MKGSDARKPELRSSDVLVTRLAWLLSKLRLWVLVGTVLVICTMVYAMASYLKRN
jgi:hypothetical protein